MDDLSNAELCARAVSALNSQKIAGFYVGDVACALVSDDGQAYTGASIGGHLGVCAEQSAVSVMVSAGPPRIRKIVAVWRAEDGVVHVLPPCGRCREFLRTLSQDNLKAEVILGPGHSELLGDLLPFHGWHAEPLCT